MLQMVRTLAQFSITLEEMNEHGENTGDEGGGGGGEDAVDRDAVGQFRSSSRNGNSGGNLNGNGLCAGNPNGEVEFPCADCRDLGVCGPCLPPFVIPETLSEPL